MLGSEILQARRVDLKCGIVHEDVQLAECLYRAGNDAFADLLFGNIAGEKDTVAALSFDLLLSRPGILFLVQMGNGDIRAFPGKENRYRSADAGVASRDQRDLA